jgi:transcription initiation factor TFIIIB Brf1 subunit/transcription initiation factor TFIIB
VRSPDKSQLLKNLENLGVNDKDVCRLVEKIFKITSDNRPLRGKNRKIVLAASLHYTYHYLGQQVDFEDILNKLGIDRKDGSKGLRICQIAMQECKELESELTKLVDQVSFTTLTYTESFQKLMRSYNIPKHKHHEVEQLLIKVHAKKNKQLTNQINSLWIACIYFWVLTIRPQFDIDDFLTLNHICRTDKLKINNELKFIQKHILTIKN